MSDEPTNPNQREEPVMGNEMTFQDRMFLESEAVYQQIQQGQCQDAQAALMEAQMRASADDQQNR